MTDLIARLEGLSALVQQSRADFIAHREPESVSVWSDLATGGPLMELVLFALVSIP